MSRAEWKYLFLIFVVFIAACIETDIYLPAFPDMMSFFAVSEEMIQSLLTWNFLGICISGPLYGPVSDSIGRKKPLIAALGLFLIGSVITLFADSFELMLVGRLLQGLGSGGCFTLGTAILFDAFQAEKAVLSLNRLNAFIPFVMAIAPMAGGYLNHIYGFRSNFLAITIFVLVSMIICLFFFDETLAKEKRTPLQMRTVLRDFKEALACLPLWQITIMMSLLFAAYLAFLSGAAVLFVIELGVSKEALPFYQAAILGAWLLATVVFNRVLTRWGNLKVKMAGTAGLVLGCIGCVIAALIAPRNPYLPTAFMMIYTFGINWIMSLYFPEGMEILPHIKGVVASLLTSMRLLLTALIVGIASYCYNATIYPIIAVVVFVTVIVLPTIILYERRSKAKGLTRQSEFNSFHG